MLLKSASDLIPYLSEETQKEVTDKIIESATFVKEFFGDWPQGKYFEYNTPSVAYVVYGYVAFWDRRQAEHFVVIATHGFHRQQDLKIPEAGILMIEEMIREYFTSTQ